MKWLFSLFLCLQCWCATALPLHEEDTRLTKTIDRDFGMPQNGYLEVINKYGQIVINTWEKDSVKVSIKITAYGKDYSDAEKMLDRVDIDFRQTNPYLTVETVLDRKSGFFKELWNNVNDYSKTLLSKNKLEIDYEIFMPAGMNVDLDNKFGDIYMQEITGKAEVRVMHGNLRANRFHAPVSIEAGYGDVRIKEIADGRLDFKAVEAEIRKAGDVEVVSSSSEMVFVEADRLKVDSRSDTRFRVNKVNYLRGKALFSKIEVEELHKTLDLDLNYGDLKVMLVAFSFSRIDINARLADIALDFQPGSFVEADITGLEHKLLLPAEDVDLKKNYTDDKKYVRLNGKMGSKNNYPGYLYINSSGGEVAITLPGFQHSVNK